MRHHGETSNSTIWLRVGSPKDSADETTIDENQPDEDREHAQNVHDPNLFP